MVSYLIEVGEDFGPRKTELLLKREGFEGDVCRCPWESSNRLAICVHMIVSLHMPHRSTIGLSELFWVPGVARSFSISLALPPPRALSQFKVQKHDTWRQYLAGSAPVLGGKPANVSCLD